MSTSNTPRTDAISTKAQDFDGLEDCTPAWFARQLERELQQATAERDEARADLGKFLTADAKNAASHATLRARVAKLEKDLEHAQKCVKFHSENSVARLARAEQAEQRNAELVAALDYIAKWVEADGADEKYDREILRVCALARAESATSKSDPNSSEIRMSESAAPAKHCEDCAPEFGCWDGGEPCYKQPLVKTAPAKHPDYRDHLDELLHDGNAVFAELTREAKKFTSPQCVSAVLDALKRAARKQGGAA